MARSFSNTKVLSSLITNAINVRGFSSAVPQLLKGGAAASNGGVKKPREEMTADNGCWVPDPRTGCYRPEYAANVIDPAESRELLSKKN